VDILIIAILIILNGFFAMAEIAIVSSKKTKLEKEARSGSKGARTVLKLLSKPEDFLSTVQIGITLIGIFAGAFGGVALAEDLVPFFQKYDQVREYAFELSLFMVVGIITYFSLVIGELVPKSIAFNNPEGIAVFVAPFMLFLSIIAKPFVVVLSWSTKLVQKIFFIKQKSEQPVSEEELKIMLEYGAKHGSFDKYEAELVKSIFRFGDRDAYSIMTNRQDIIWIDVNASVEEIKKIVAGHRFSNYPVCEQNLDNITGMVNTQVLLQELNTPDKFDLRKITFDPIYVPDSLPSFRIIERFKAGNKFVAVVVDEFGAVEGMITKQDLLENIIGVLPGETHYSETPEIVKRSDGSWLVSGSVHIDELVERIEVNLIIDEDQYVTLGGFVMAILGKIPAEGDKFEYKGYNYEVMDMDGKRVDKVMIKPVEIINLTTD
jgi:putative hemolysin